MQFLGPHCSLMLSANKDIFTPSLHICIPMIYFPCIVTQAMSPSTMFNRYGKCGHPSLVSDGTGYSELIYIYKDTGCKTPLTF